MVDGEKLRKLRKEHGYTIKELGEASGLAYNVIHTLETGKANNCNLKTLLKLCDMLYCSVDDLIDYDYS